jgi:hypothetical protein
MTLDFSVVAFSVEELHPMWERINYLVGLTQPAGYTEHKSGEYYDKPYLAGFIIPPMLKFNLGDLYKNQPMVLTNVGVTIPTEAGWETTSERQSRAYTKYDYEFLNEAIQRGIPKGNDTIDTNNRVYVAQLPTTATISISMKFLNKRLPKVGNRQFADSPEEHGTQMHGLSSIPNSNLGMGHNIIHPPQDRFTTEGWLTSDLDGLDEESKALAGTRFIEEPSPFEGNNPPKPEPCFPPVGAPGDTDEWDRPTGPEGTSAADKEVALQRNQKRWAVDVMIYIASEMEKEPPPPFPAQGSAAANVQLVTWIKSIETASSSGGITTYDESFNDAVSEQGVDAEPGSLILRYEGFEYQGHILAWDWYVSHGSPHPKYYNPALKQQPPGTTGAPFYVAGEIPEELGEHFNSVPVCLNGPPPTTYPIQEPPFMPPECVYVLDQTD